MSDAFGDIEPEDSWDLDDPVPEQIENVRRRVELLGQHVRNCYGVDDDPIDAVDELGELVDRAAARRDLTDRDQLRIRDCYEDLDFIRSRL